MEPGSAVRSKCEPLLSVFEGSEVPGANEPSSTGKVESPWGSQNLRKCMVGPTKIDVGKVCVSRVPKRLTRWSLEAP